MTISRKSRCIAAVLIAALLLSMLPAGLVLAQTVQWTAATKGSWARLDEGAAVLQRPNLLAGVTPTWGENPWIPKDNTVLATSTDGQLCQNGDVAARTIFTAPWGDWLPLTYDLGQTYALQDFVVASSDEGSVYAPHLIRVYVADNFADLYAEQNRVVQAEKFDITGDQWQFKADTAKTGRYVGFAFYCADGTKDETEEPNAFLNGQRISNIWYGSLRIGEIGVYVAQEEWNDAEVGSYRAVTAAPENNLLAGLTPTGWVYDNNQSWQTKDGTDMALLTDGQLSVNGSGDFVGFGLFGAGGESGDWRQFTFDMGAVQTVREFLLGSCGGDNAGLRECWVQVYAGTDRDTLYSDGNKVAERKGLTATERNVLLRAAQAVAAQYVGFRLYTPAGCAWGNDSEGFGIGPWYDTRRLGELGAYAEKPAQEEWNDAEVGSYRAVTAAPENNLLAGLTPTGWVYDNNQSWQTKDGTDMALLTDGQLSVNGSGDFVGFGLFGAGGESGDWRQFTFDMGAVQTVREFLLGSCGGDNAGLRECWVQVYAGTDRDTLYSDGNKVAERKGLTATERNVLLRAAQAVAAQYVGFRLYTPAGCAWGNDSEGFGVGPWYDTRRLGELGAYAEKPAQNEWSQAAKGSWMRLTDDAPVLQRPNRLAGVTPTWGENPWIPKDNTVLATSTDGKLCQNGAASTIFTAPWGDWLPLTYDLGRSYEVQDFVVASSGEGSLYAPHLIRIYVADSPDDLYTEQNRMVQAEKFDITGEQWQFKADSAKAGRYVGFEFYCADGTKEETEEPNAFLNGQRISNIWYGSLRIGEIGVYSETATNSWTQATVGSWRRLNDTAEILQEPNRLNGITPFSGAVREPLLPKDDTVLAVSTDGKLCLNGDTAARTIFPAPYGDWIQMSYKLDAIYALQQFALAGSGEGSGYVPHLIRIYVGANLSNLYAEENRVVQAEKFDITGQDWEFQAAEARQGQYVGFELYCPDGTKSEAEEPNAYLNGRKISEIWYACLRIGEIGAYGDRVGDAPPDPVDLIAGKEPTDAFQIEARGIDNRTAVNEKGEPGTGNTGTLKDAMALVFEEPASNLTDGDYSTRGATSHGVKIPMKNEYDMDYQLLQYDTPWQVLVYHLGGESKLSEIRVTSSDEYNYHLAGVQYYAAYRYADLFKNESLLYTTGGEYYHYDAENERYMQDVERDTHNQRTLSYTLTPAQAAGTYRFVAVVVTRPYGTYDRTYPEQRVVGYASARMSEIEVEGVLTQPEVPPTTAYEQQTVLGTVRVQVAQLNADDTDFFETVLHGFTLEAAALPADVERHTYGNWLTVDGEQMYTIRLVDGTGTPLTDAQLGGRLVGITLPATAAYHQTVGRMQDGGIAPMLNAYTRPDGTIQASALNYPVYHNLENNREDAIIRTASVSLVYLKFNDLDTINRLNGRRTNTPLQAAFVAGESRLASAAPVWRYAAGGGAVMLLLAAGFAVRRKRRTAGKGGESV